MSGYVPPYPFRPSTDLTIWQRYKLWRKDMLACWEESAFECDFVSVKFLNRRIFLCNSPESVQFALSSHNDSFGRKSPQHRHSLIPLLGDGLFVSDGELWRKRRRVVAPILHASRLAAYAPVMLETALETRARWSGLPPGAEIDALAEMAQLTAEIICRTIFGRQLGRDDAAEVVRNFSEYQRHIMKVDLISSLGLPDWVPHWYPPRVRRAAAKIHAVLDRIIEGSRAQRDKEHASMFAQMSGACDHDTGMTLDARALRNEAAVLFMAGHETTANALAWTWFLLSQAPEVEARLHAEIDQVLGDRPPTLDDVPKLVYTRAVFEETIRLYPPVPLLSRETTVDETFNGRSIPKRSIIFVMPWLLHRKKKLWDRPDHFIPERFLPGGETPASKFSYIAFSTGPRICPGMRFGLTEAVLCIATLAQKFRLRLKPGHEVMAQCRLTLRPGDHLPMQLHRREASTSGPAAESGPTAPACPVDHG